MVFNLKNIIFNTKFWEYYDITSDPNKDSNNKGTVQRYHELLGDDFDINTGPLINDLVANNVDPTTALVKFLIYLECSIGGGVFIGSNEYIRRSIIKYATRWHRVRSTKLGYQTMFCMLGLTVNIVEKFGNDTLDSDTEDFDGDVRLLDSSCEICSRYCVELTTTAGWSPTSENLRAIFNIIEFNEPINALLDSVELDGQCIELEIISILVESNGDLTYDPTNAPSTILDNLANGDAEITGTNSGNYVIDSNGDLIYNC